VAGRAGAGGGNRRWKLLKDLVKAEEYFEEREVLSPKPYTLLQTTLFHFYIRRDFSKTIAKVDEIKSPGI
jgi:hypothetical protein